jgi:hypothetical protein
VQRAKLYQNRIKNWKGENMITRNWKIVKGTAERRGGATLSSNDAYYQYVDGVFNVEGNQVELITVGAGGNGSSGYYDWKSISRTNENLLCIWSDDYNQLQKNYYVGGSGTCYAGGYSKVVFGSGSTPATAEDYAMEEPITSGITRIERSFSTNYNEETNNFECLITYHGRVSKDMVIREVGIVKSILKAQSRGNTGEDYWENILCSRDVLTPALDLKAGDGFRVTIKVEM